MNNFDDLSLKNIKSPKIDKIKIYENIQIILENFNSFCELSKLEILFSKSDQIIQHNRCNIRYKISKFLGNAIVPISGFLRNKIYEYFAGDDIHGTVGNDLIKKRLLLPHNYNSTFANSYLNSRYIGSLATKLSSKQVFDKPFKQETCKQIGQYIKAKTPYKEDYGFYLRLCTLQLDKVSKKTVSQVDQCKSYSNLENKTIEKHHNNKYKNRKNKEHDRKIILIIPGNGEAICSAKYQNNFDSIACKIDLCFVEYPINPISVKSLIYAALSGLQRCIDSGYKIKNIIVYGYSIGGGVSAAAIQYSQKIGIIKHNQKLCGYINENSYTRISTVCARWLNRNIKKSDNNSHDEEIITKKVKTHDDSNIHDKKNTAYALKAYHSFSSKMLSYIAQFFHSEIDVVDILKSNLQVQKIIISGMQNDEVIGNQASLVKYMKAQYEVCQDMQNIGNGILKQSRVLLMERDEDHVTRKHLLVQVNSIILKHFLS